MSVYLGDTKVGVAFHKDRYNEITPEQMAEFNDAVNYRTGEINERNISQMIEDLKEKYFIHTDIELRKNMYEEPWVRPQSWPDLDSLNLQMEGNDFIYMTYDTTGGKCAIALHIEKSSGGQNITCEIGHITNGIYIVDETITGSNNDYIKWYDEASGYPVVRVTGDIKYCFVISATKDGATQLFKNQPIVERIAYVPHLENFCSSYSSNCWGVYTLQREKFNNGDGTKLTSFYYAWAWSRELRDLDITGLKTSNRTFNMANAFRECYNLNSLDLRVLIPGKIISLESTFSSCHNLKSIDIRGLDMSACTTLNSTFGACYSLREIKGISDIDTNKITSVYYTFQECYSIKELDLSNWNISNITSLNCTFYRCLNLIKLDLHGWDVSKVTNCYRTFSKCWSLKELNLTGWQTGILTNASSLFEECSCLSEIDPTIFKVTSACRNIYHCFYNCHLIKHLDLSSWTINNLENSSMSGIFSNCYSLETLKGISNWIFNIPQSLSGMFSGCYSLKSLDISNWDVSQTTSLQSFFYNCWSLEEIDVSSFDTSACTNLATVFLNCVSLKRIIGLENWNTSNVTTMSELFSSCRSLRVFPSIQNWDYSKVTTINNMFYLCGSLKEIILPNLSLPKCTTINSAFRYCYILEKINTSNWSMPSMPNSSSHSMYADNYMLKYIIGISIPLNYTRISFANCTSFTHDSILFLLNALPQTTAGHTIYLSSQIINSLTTAEKAIATNKNWTIAS